MFSAMVDIYYVYSGTRDWTKVTLMERSPYYRGAICTVEYNLGLSQGECNSEVFLLVRCP